MRALSESQYGSVFQLSGSAFGLHPELPSFGFLRMSYRSLTLYIIIRLLTDNSKHSLLWRISFLCCFISQFSNPRSNFYLCSYTVQKPSFCALWQAIYQFLRYLGSNFHLFSHYNISENSTG